MLVFLSFIISLVSATGISITEPVDGESYDGDWLTIRAIIENENVVPDSVHYTLNGEPVIQIPRLNTDWPTYMQNYLNHGYSESPAPMTNAILWTAPVTGMYHEFPTPVVVDGMVFYTADSIGQGTTDSLYALDAVTGELIWKYDTGHADDAVTVVDGRLYSASDSLFCFDALTGTRLWANGIADHTGSTPIVLQGSVFCGKNSVSAHESGVYCLDALSGELIWADTVLNYPSSCMALSDDILIIPTPTAGGVYYGILYAIDATTGEIIWESTESEIGYWDSSPVIVDGAIYINDWYERTLAFDLYSGDLIWEQPTGGGTATIAYHDEKLFFGAEGSGPYYCLDATDGSAMWSVPGNQHGSSGIADGLVFFGEDVSVNDSSRVVALDCETGAEIWSYKTYSGGSPTGFQGSPSITDGIMYYPCTDGYLYAFGTGLKYTYLDDLYAQIGTNELIVTSYDAGTAVAADTINFSVLGTGISMLEPTISLGLSTNPNPFYSSTMISFELPESEFTSINVYDLSGRIVSVLNSSLLEAGKHTIHWNGCNRIGQRVSAGLYLCRIQSGAGAETIGLCLLR